jgi:hypothetical protein
MFETGRKRMRATAIARRNLGSRRRSPRKLQRQLPDADEAAGGGDPFYPFLYVG